MKLLQSVPYTHTFKFQIIRDVSMCSHVQSHKLKCSRFWPTLLHVCILYKWLCFCVLRVDLYFKLRMSRSKCKSSSDTAGSARKCQMVTIETKIKINESGARWKDDRPYSANNWRTREIYNAENDRELFLIWGSTASFEAQDCIIEHSQMLSSRSEYNLVLSCHLWWDKKEILPRYHWVIFSS